MRDTDIPGSVSVIPLIGIGAVEPGADLVKLITAALGPEAGGPELLSGDVLVVTQKVVSKAENRLVPIDESDPEAKRRLVESEAARIVRRRGDLLIAETRHGFVCANAGIDLSNAELGWAALLPVDADRSARRLRADLRRALDVEVGVVISDTFGRPWRRGLTDVAIGCAGISAILDLRGSTDAQGRELVATEVCIADEVASAGELVMGKDRGIPAAIVRGVPASWLRDGSVVDEVVRPPAEDLFR
jgi:coenzyme F420-0:L-glutamate ligase / coenzyme F420-1:gamma-L-glutamate ligase